MFEGWCWGIDSNTIHYGIPSCLKRHFADSFPPFKQIHRCKLILKPLTEKHQLHGINPMIQRLYGYYNGWFSFKLNTRREYINSNNLAGSGVFNCNQINRLETTGRSTIQQYIIGSKSLQKENCERVQLYFMLLLNDFQKQKKTLCWAKVALLMHKMHSQKA